MSDEEATAEECTSNNFKTLISPIPTDASALKDIRALEVGNFLTIEYVRTPIQ